MRRQLLFTLFTASVLAMSTRSTSKDEPPSVEVFVTSMQGEPIDSAHVRSVLIGPNQAETKVGSHCRFDRLVPGVYEFDISSPGFVSKRVSLDVSQPKLLLRIGLKLGYPDNIPVSVLTVKTPRPLSGGSYSDYWVRLIPILGDDMIEGRLDHMGSCAFLGLSPGTYAVFILKGESIVGFDQMAFTGRETTIEIQKAIAQ